jgi:sensor histidine kinase YesM
VRAEGSHRGVGLENARQRLEQLHPGAYRLSLDAGHPNGAVATVVLPLRHQSEPPPPLRAEMMPVLEGGR